MASVIVPADHTDKSKGLRQLRLRVPIHTDKIDTQWDYIQCPPNLGYLSAIFSCSFFSVIMSSLNVYENLYSPRMVDNRIKKETRTSLNYRLVNIEVSSIADTLSPILFKYRWSYRQYFWKKLSIRYRRYFWTINIAIPIHFHGRRRERRKHWTRPALA